MLRPLLRPRPQKCTMSMRFVTTLRPVPPLCSTTLPSFSSSSSSSQSQSWHRSRSPSRPPSSAFQSVQITHFREDFLCECSRRFLCHDFAPMILPSFAISPLLAVKPPSSPFRSYHQISPNISNYHQSSPKFCATERARADSLKPNLTNFDQIKPNFFSARLAPE